MSGIINMLGDVLARSRAYLNDEEATNWPDTRLIPKARIAFEELEAELIIAGIPIIHSVTTVITVPAWTSDDTNQDLSQVSGYPTDMYLPIWMKEREVGQMNRDFVDMIETDFIPNVDMDINLRYWCWFQNTILLRGSLNSNQVQLRYQRFLPIPGVNTDSIIVPLAQLFLAPRVASLAFQAVGNDPKKADLRAESVENLDRIIRMNIKQLQDTPAKRRPYHRGIGRNRVLRDY
jgi:hypothetical protein